MRRGRAGAARAARAPGRASEDPAHLTPDARPRSAKTLVATTSPAPRGQALRRRLPLDARTPSLSNWAIGSSARHRSRPLPASLASVRLRRNGLHGRRGRVVAARRAAAQLPRSGARCGRMRNCRVSARAYRPPDALRRAAGQGVYDFATELGIIGVDEPTLHLGACCTSPGVRAAARAPAERRWPRRRVDTTDQREPHAGEASLLSAGCARNPALAGSAARRRHCTQRGGRTPPHTLTPHWRRFRARAGPRAATTRWAAALPPPLRAQWCCSTRASARWKRWDSVPPPLHSAAR